MQVMTFNIRNGRAGDGVNCWDRRKAFACDVIRDVLPDVLGVQEAFRFQLDDMDSLLPGYAELGIGREGGTEGEYAAILYLEDRLSVNDTGTFWLSETPDAPSIGWGAKYRRVCTWAHFVEKSSGQAFYIYNVHLDHQVRAAQVNGTTLLMRRISERDHNDPVILIGDLNVGECDEIVAYVQGRATLSGENPVPLIDTFRVAQPEAHDVCTWHAFGEEPTGRKIDYIFASPDTRVLESSIIRTQRAGRFPSDHYPVTARISLVP